MREGIPPQTGAFSLVEVILAIGIVSFAFLAVVALLPIGLKTVRESSDESEAMNLLPAVAADLKTISPTTGKSLRFGMPDWTSATNLESGRFFLDQNGAPQPERSNARYVVDWRVIPPEGWASNPRTQLLAPVRVSLRIGWPSLTSEPLGYVETLIVLLPEKR
jgi:uncharacterized protein (TIGR02598 family)